MAIKMSMHQQIQLFESLFGEHDPVTQLTKALVTQGGLIDVSLYVVKVNFQGKTHTQTLTVGTTALMKGSVSPLLISQNKFMLKTFIEGLMGKADPVLVSTPVDYGKVVDHGIVVGVDLAKEADKTVVAPAQSIAKGGPVIKLKDATKLGQKVEGTSSGSVYRVVALNDRVKVATRLNSGEVSMRVEFKNPTMAEKAALSNVFSMKSGYGSLHTSLGAVPAHRVVGALLFTLDGIEFDQLVHGAAQLKEANA